MVKRKRAARVPTTAAHERGAESETEMAVSMPTGFADAYAQFSAQEAADYPDWGQARELAFHSSGGKAEKPPYLLNEKTSEVPSRPGRKSGRRASDTFKGEAPLALHRSWAAFLMYKLAYERRNGVRLEVEEETSVAEYNSELAGRVSGRTRGTGGRGGDQKSELPPELLVWRRVFRCSPPENDDDDSAACSFGFTATVEFVGSEWMVRVADGQFHHSHALPSPVEPPISAAAESPVAHAGAESPLLRAPTTRPLSSFLDSPLMPNTDDGRLTRNIYLAVRPVANAIIDELMEWKEEYVVSELANLADYLTRLQQRGREVARRNPVAPSSYGRPLDMVGFAFPTAVAPSPEPPLYSRLPRENWAVAVEAASSGQASRAKPTQPAGPSVVEAAEATVTSRISNHNQETSRSSSAESDNRARLRHALAKRVEKRISRPLETVEDTPRTRSTGTTATETRPRRQIPSVKPTNQPVSKTKDVRLATAADAAVEKTQSTRRRATPVSPDQGQAAVSRASDAQEEEESDTPHTSSRRVELARRARDTSTLRHSRGQQALGLSIDTTQEPPATKRRRTLQTEEAKSSQAAVATVREDSTSRGVRIDARLDTSRSTREGENSAATIPADPQPQPAASKPLSAREKSPKETAEADAAATHRADSSHAAVSSKTTEQSTATLKPPRLQSNSAADAVRILNAEPPPTRRSRSTSPSALSSSGTKATAQPSMASTDKTPADQDTASKRRVSPRHTAGAAVANTSTTKGSTGDAAAKPTVTSTPKTRSPRAVVQSVSKPLGKSVVSIDQWLAKMKPSASTTPKKPKKPTTPVEMFSRFSLFPPLHSFRGQAPSTATADDAADWDVVLVPRFVQLPQKSRATEQTAMATPSHPQKPQVLL